MFDLETFRLDARNGNPQDVDEGSSVPESVPSSGEESAQTAEVAVETVVSSVGSTAPTMAREEADDADSGSVAKVAPLGVEVQPEDVASNAPSVPTLSTFTTFSGLGKNKSRARENPDNEKEEEEDDCNYYGKDLLQVLEDEVDSVVTDTQSCTTRGSTVGANTVDLMAEHMEAMSTGADTAPSLPSFATFTTKSANNKTKKNQLSRNTEHSDTSKVSSVISVPMPKNTTRNNQETDEVETTVSDLGNSKSTIGRHAIPEDMSTVAEEPSAYPEDMSGPTAPTFTTHSAKRIPFKRASSFGSDTAVSALSMNGAPTVALTGDNSVASFLLPPPSALKNSNTGRSSANTSKARASRTSSLAPSTRPVQRSTKAKQEQQKMVMDQHDGVSVDHHYASDMALLGGVLGREDMTSGLEDVVGAFLRKGALVGLGIWIFLLILIVIVAPGSSYHYSNGPEQMANATLLVLLVGVNFNRLGPLFVNDRKNNWEFLTSGSMMASCTVQFMAICSVAIMFLFPAPVIVDVMGVRCHLVRWAEWTALAFVMCFLTESIDLPLEDADDKHAWMTAIAIAVSTACGGFMGFAKDEATWYMLFFTAWVLFCVLFVRLSWRGTRLLSTPKPVTTSEREDYERAKYSFKLMAICTVIWTLLAASWSCCALLYKFAEPGSIWSNDWLILCVENVCEALSKIGYLSILMEVHEALFDEASQTARRLGELRAYMSAVWDVSTDVVIICSSHDHLVNAAVSPAFYKMETGFGFYLSEREKILANADPEKTTLVMEVDPYEGSYRTFEMDLSQPMSRQEASYMLKSNRTKARMVAPVFEKNLKVLSELVCDATTFCPGTEKQYTLRQEFFCTDRNRNEEVMQVDAKVVRLKDKTFLIVLRDVTRRHSTGAAQGNPDRDTRRRRSRDSSRSSRETVKAQNSTRSSDDESDDAIEDILEEVAMARTRQSRMEEVSDDGIREMMQEAKPMRSLRDDASDDGIKEMMAEVAAAKAMQKSRSQHRDKELMNSVQQIFGSLPTSRSEGNNSSSRSEDSSMARQAKEMRERLFAAMPDEDSAGPGESIEKQDSDKESSDANTSDSVKACVPVPREESVSKESAPESPLDISRADPGTTQVDSSASSSEQKKPGKKKSKNPMKKLYRKVVGSSK